MASAQREPITGVWTLEADLPDRPPNLPPCKNSSDLYQFQERPLAKVGWACPPQSSPWRCHCLELAVRAGTPTCVASQHIIGEKESTGATRGTRSLLQLRRSWGPSLFGPLRLLQRAVILLGTVRAYRTSPDLPTDLIDGSKEKSGGRELEKQGWSSNGRNRGNGG